MKQLSLSYFGAFQAAVNGQPLTNFRSSKIQGLLIYLTLTAQQAHSRDGLTALFWPDESESAAKQNLRVSLYRLRQLLGDDDDTVQQPFLLISRATVQFNPDSAYSLDVVDLLHALERSDLETVVSHFQGDLLPAFTCNSFTFDDWLRQERERYHRLVLDALFNLTVQKLAQADFQTAQNLARQQLTLEPWREEAHQQLIQALALQGKRSAAIAQYETCRAVLAAELGLEPAAETTELAARIRRQQVAQSSAPRMSDATAGQLTIPFVGRQAEYAELVEAYQKAADGGLRVVTLQGNAGIGKTRLTEQFLAWAAMQGADVLQGSAFETSEKLSYQPLTQLIRRRLERENAPDDLLSDFWLSQLARLLPELRDRYPDLSEPTQEENTAREHLFEAIARLIQALAERRPLLIVIDDWHWADAASLDVLHYAAVRWAEEGLPILLLLGLRQEAISASSAVQSWLTRLNHSVPVQALQLDALSQAVTTQLVQTLLESQPGEPQMGEPLTRFSDWLFAETAGQPLFLTEMLKALAADEVLRPTPTSVHWQLDEARFEAVRDGESGHITSGIEQIIKEWTQRITDPANKLLAAASVLTQERTFDQLCSVAELAEDEALTALDELLSIQLLLEFSSGAPFGVQGSTFNFSHQNVAAVVYDILGATRQRILHRRAFATLREHDAPAADLAHHARHAGLLVETVRHSLIAGNEAMALFAVRVALHHYQTAWQAVAQHGWPEQLSGADRQALYSGLGRAYELTEAWTQAKDCYEAMIAAAQEMDAEAMECMGLNHLATVYNTGLINPQQGIALLERARLLAEQCGDQRGMAETEWNLSRTHLHMGERDRALEHAQQALTLARELDHPLLLARGVQGVSFALTQHRQWEEAERYAAEAQKQYAEVGNLIMAADNQRMVGGCQLQSGYPQKGLATMEEALAFSQQVENLWGQAESARFLSTIYAELGNYGEALKMAREAITQAQKVGEPIMTNAKTAVGFTYRAIMALDIAQKYQLEVMAATAAGGFNPFPDWTLSELCAVYAMAGEWAQAHDYAKQVLEFHAGSDVLPMGMAGWYETEAMLRGGDGDLARLGVERQALVVGQNRRYHLPLLRSQAVLAQWDGAPDQAIAHLDAALALARAIGLPGEEWPILAALGALYVEQGEQDQAQQAYQSAKAIIGRLAGTIDESDLRAQFLAADLVRAVLDAGVTIKK